MSFNADKNGATWNNIDIGPNKPIRYHLEMMESPEKYEWVIPNELPQPEMEIVSTKLHPHPEKVLRDMCEVAQNRAERNTHNFKVLDKRSKEQKEEIEDLYDHISVLLEKVHRLEESKLNRPSYEESMDDALLYVDDMLKAAQALNRRKFARKQRLKKQIEKVKEATKSTTVRCGQKLPRKINPIIVTLAVMALPVLIYLFYTYGIPGILITMFYVLLGGLGV